jgi:dGTPase
MDATAKPSGHLIGPIFEAPDKLAPFATKPPESRGRFYPEAESATRTCYARDRDRIIHSTAFRRLKHKTQVFVQHEGDLYRTRLTHSLEVAQIARSVARVLAVDEDLAETGEEALNEATKDIGGFDHNAHALRLVTKLEHRYADFDGLNLAWETLEGLVKHNGPLIGQGAKPLPTPIASFDARWPLDLSSWPGLEAQIAALADDIAYVNHDIDDGLRAELFSVGDLEAAPLVGPHVKAIGGRYGKLESGRLIGEIVRKLMSALIGDMTAETKARLEQAKPKSAAQIRAQFRAMVSFSQTMGADIVALKGFLFARMYRHPHVMGSMEKAKGVVVDLFGAFSHDPSLLPVDWAAQCGQPGDPKTGGVVRDYIAGMTDRFALEEHRRIFHIEIAL